MTRPWGPEFWPIISADIDVEGTFCILKSEQALGDEISRMPRLVEIGEVVFHFARQKFHQFGKLESENAAFESNRIRRPAVNGKAHGERFRVVSRDLNVSPN
jgi:hypothetical protein